MKKAPHREPRGRADAGPSYPDDAFQFIREGLSFAVQQVHGPESPAQTAVFRFLLKNQIDLDDLRELYESDKLSESLRAAVEEAGGIDCLNRHVSGADLCWGLRDYAHYRWGCLADIVLRSWNISSTYDFGRIVFELIEAGQMQKQPSDALADFQNVYDFAEVLSRSYAIDLNGC